MNAQAFASFDLQQIFNALPGLCLMVAADAPRFTILAVTDAYLYATRQQRSEMLGRGLFEALPENSDDAAIKAAQNVETSQHVRASLERAIAQSAADKMPVQRRNIVRLENGGSEERYWTTAHTPIINADGKIAYLIQQLEDVTDSVLQQKKEAQQQSLADALAKESAALEAANRALRESRRAALNLTEDAIAARRQVEQAAAALRTSEARFRGILKQSPAGIVETDATGRMTLVNQRWCDMLGYSEAELLQMSVMDVTHQSSLTATIAALERVAKGGPDFQIEKNYCRKDGSIINAQSNVVARRGADGEFQGLLAVILDVTERVRAQENLRISEERLNLAMTGANIGAFDWNIKTGEIAWTKETEESAAMTAKDFGKSFEGFINLIHPLDRDLLHLRINEALETGDYECEFRMMKGDGTIRWVIGKGRVSYDQDGSPTRLVGVDIDITKRKLAEQQLIEQQAFTSSIIETAPTVLYTYDLQANRPTYLTNQSATVLGYSFEEINDNRDEFMVRHLHPEDVQQAQQHFQQISNENNGEVFEFEYRMRHKSGEWRWFRSRDRVFKRDDQGQAREILGIALDITERKQASEALRQRNQQLDLLARASQKLIVSERPETEILQEIFADVAAAVRTEMFFNFLVAEDGETLRLTTSGGLSQKEKDFFATIHFGEYLCGTVAQRREKLVVEDLQQCKFTEAVTLHKAGVTAYSGFPLVAHGKLIGTVAFATKHRTHFDTSDLQMIQTVCDQVSIMLERARTEAALRASHNTFQHLVENSPFGVYVVDADFRLAQVSKGAQKVFANVHPLLGRDFADVIRVIWPEPFATEVIANFQHTLATGEPYHAPSTLEQRGDINEVQAYDWKVERLTLPDGRYGAVCHFYDLSERQRYEAQLGASEERMRLVLSAAKIGIWIYDLVNETIWWSPEHYEIFGINPVDVTVTDFKQFVHPDDLPGVWDQFIESVKNGVPYQPEFRILRPDGEICWVGNLGHVEYDENGKPLRFLSSVFDITERKRRELNLAFLADVQRDLITLTSPQQLRQTMAAQIAAHLKLSRCVFVEINEATDEARILHDHNMTAHPQLNGMYRLADFHDETEVRQLATGTPLVVNDVRQELRSAARATQFEALGIRALLNAPYVSDGRWRFVLSALQELPRQWRADEIELMKEVTERIYVRLERARVEANLRENKERLALALNSAVMGVWSWDFLSNNVYWSPETYAIFGRTDFDGTAEAFQRTLHPEDAERVWTTVNAAIASHTIYEAEFRIIRGDDSVRWVANRGRAEYDATGQPTRMLGIAVDIEARKQAEAERERLLAVEQQLRETAEHATRAKDEFLALVTHELRNPLNSILGYTLLTKAKAHDAALVERNCKIIERSARIQQQLIDDLLDTARIVSGKLKIETTPTDLRLVLEDALTVIRPAAEAKQIELVAEFHDAFPQVTGDAARLQQVAWNLLQNSIKFTPEGGRVELRLERTDRHMRIVVSDTGKGIEPEFLPHLFDRFSQNDTSRTRRYGGLGLGLALVKQLVELHGGTITAASEGANQGATFTVELPMQAPQYATPAQAVRAIAEISNGPDALSLTDLPRLDGMRVLVVDDMEEARTLVADTLSNWGAVVTMADSGQEAEGQLSQTAFDIMVCDIALPDVDGHEVIRRIRRREQERGLARSQQLPAIALTALARSEDRLQALKAGFQMHVAKPIELAELILAISTLIAPQRGASSSN